jgi:VIT1/CCC1 family predicted Fe2+/Mn2+ transporter
MAHDPVDAQLESDHGILEIMSRAETVRTGIGSAIAYLLGAAIPLMLTLAVPAAVEGSLILAAVLFSLIVTSAIGARTGHMNLRRTLARAHGRSRDIGRELRRGQLDLLTPCSCRREAELCG